MMRIRFAVFVSVILAVFCFFQFWYPYHFFYHEQNQIFLWEWEYISGYFQKSGGLASLIGDFLTQFYYYLYAGATILTLCIALAGLLMYKTLTNLKVNPWIALALGLCVVALLTVCHFSTSYKLSSTVCVMGWLFVLWAVSAIRSRMLRWSCFMMALLPTFLLFGKPQAIRLQAPDFVLEKDFAVDNEYHFGNYDKVIDIVRNSDGWTGQMQFFYNLVYAQQGTLPEHLFDFTPNNLGTFEKIGPETPRLTIINMNELYWALGDMTFTERAAMMTNVFSPENRNVRMMKRLAECNIVSGDSAAAQKYLRILSKTFVYSRWADATQKQLAQGQLPPDLARKVPFVNHRDTITVSDNAHFLMMQLLDHNPDNMIALDYILCSDLLLKDIANFKRDYDRYCTANPRLKPLYQEALCIWLAGTDAPQEEWQRYIQRQDVLQRFFEYNNQRGNPRFKNTYWYYYDKIKAPEI
jgi:hypothetical protein